MKEAEAKNVRKHIEEARQTLADATSRLTPQREAVLRALLAHPNRHQSAEEVLRGAREYFPEIGLATVYRTLELYAKLDIVRRLDTTEGQARYEFNDDTGMHYHHHVICLNCGAIREFNEDLLDTIEERVAQATGFKLTDHCLQLYGYCPSCRESAGT